MSANNTVIWRRSPSPAALAASSGASGVEVDSAAAAGVGGGAAAARAKGRASAASAVPQLPQNLSVDATSAPQLRQCCATGAPHATQKRLPLASVTWQEWQIMLVSSNAKHRAGRGRVPADGVSHAFIKLGTQPAPLILGLILGPMMEENLRRALLLSRGDWTVFFTCDLSASLLAISALLLIVVLSPAVRKKCEEAFVED